MGSSATDHSTYDRRGVVAVVVRDRRLLVIRRAACVVSPLAYCFPGGGIEPGEDEQQALVREMHEELGAAVRPLRRLWESVTPWRTHLAWWLAEFEPDAPLLPNPAEIASLHWLAPHEMLALPELLESNRHFWAARDAGDFELRLF